MSLRKTMAYLLWPLTMWYAVGVAFRNALYALGIKRQTAPHIATIGVGNLCTGGSGKTPHTEYLLRLLQEHFQTAVLSRGYRRKSKGFVMDDGSHDAARLGDEPAMMATKFPQVQVAVCENRVEGVQQLIQHNEGLQVVVLDDVYQHRQIKPSINVLLTEYAHPYYKDHILPYGDLREFRSGRNRASIVIVTKSPAKLNPVEKHNAMHDLGLKNYQKVFFSYLRYGSLQTLDGEAAGVELRQIEWVLVVTGIAHPEPMIAEVRRHCKIQHLAFADHHDFTRRDVARIAEAYAALPGDSKAVVTTEKDAIRLRGLELGFPLYVLPVEVAFHQEPGIDFDRVILSAVQENISFLGKLSIWS